MRVIVLLCLAILIVGCDKKSNDEVYVGDSEMLVLFVHGYTGKINASRFTQDMQPVLSGYNNKYIAETYSWESGGISKNPLKNWKEANAKALDEAQELVETLELYEDKELPYYLIGYSLGAKVVIEALKELGNDLNNLHGVYLIGAAVNSDLKIGTGLFNERFKIINYHSPYHDKVLKIVYRMVSFLGKAGGRKGFKSDVEFENYETAASHSPSRGRCNFLNMSKPIAHLIAHRENKFTELLGHKPLILQVSPDNNRWNDLIRYDGYTVQQNSCDQFNNYYRVVNNDSLDIVIEGCDLPTILNLVHNKKIKSDQLTLCAGGTEVDSKY